MVCCVLEPNFPSDGEIDSGRADCRRIVNNQPLENAKRGKAALKGWFVRLLSFFFFLPLLLFPLSWGALFGKRESMKERKHGLG